MDRILIPNKEDLLTYKKLIPAISPLAVISMLELKEAGKDCEHVVTDYLQKRYGLSEGKFIALLALYQHSEGLFPKEIAAKAGLSKASVTTLLHQLEAQHLVTMAKDATDQRAKRVLLTSTGRSFLAEILPEHYLRVSNFMGNLNANELTELIRLLRKLAGVTTKPEEV